MTAPSRTHAIALSVAMASLIVLLITLINGQENAQAERDDYRRMYEDATSQPIPTITQRVTSPPKTLPPKTVEVTIRVTERASRSQIRRPDTSGVEPIIDPNTPRILKPWQRGYWVKAQTWAQTPKVKAVIMCESRNNPRAVSPTGKFRGLYQIDPGKWAGYGGLDLAPTPDRASRAAQNYVAYRIWVGNGWTPWTCA